MLSIGCATDNRGGTTPDAGAASLSISLFDVAEQAWGDAPLTVHFVWRVDNPQRRPLRCKIDYEGDGTYDVEIAHCEPDTTAALPSKLPTHTYVEPGKALAKLSVSDGKTTAEGTTELFSNQLVFAPNVVFFEKLPGFVSASPWSGGVTLKFQPDAVPSIAADSILWGTSDGGYLLRVRHVSGADDTLTVEGVAAAMEEAIEHGFIGARDVSLPFPDPVATIRVNVKTAFRSSHLITAPRPMCESKASSEFSVRLCRPGLCSGPR